ncbi:aminodeoxychorismate lyase [Thalassotalea insulae]|uniref:Aminodeoxychorismate lyase n=1 Tax=Thalassotalea insulae TaxID=2056778 RepID=A0ABQ6GLA2_9GAMM|nr:aminodeoxychorismate lyase [Thalassotalea insulae]GLX76793.1 aminodeoxychorismate lyase [Thalassotalea insulae]
MFHCFINGQRQQQIATDDRGLAYGDGLFTTAKVVNGEVQWLAEHLTRLVEGCRYLKISYDHQALVSELNQAVSACQLAVVKVMITAGSGGRGYSRQGALNAQRIISLHPMPTRYSQWAQQGITLENANIQLGLNPLLKGLKHLNRLEQVLLRAELDQRDCDDLLVCNINNEIIETSCANLFWFHRGRLYTPELSDSGVKGLYRQQILAQDANIEVVKATLADVTQLDAMFICNSIMGIVPVRCYQGQVLALDKVLHYRAQFNQCISQGK